MKPKLHLGMESDNLHLFVSRCCGTAISVEPLVQLTCCACRNKLRYRDAIWNGKHNLKEQRV